MESCVKKKILVIGATNFPERLDPAVLRSGRIDKRIFIPPPDLESRAELFKLLLEGRPCSDDINFDKLAYDTDSFLSSDIKLLVNTAALKALQSNMLISRSILLDEVTCFTPSLNKDEIDRYLKFASFQRGSH